VLKVLIVENDVMIADYLEDVLVDGGYEVCGIATHVDEAIRLGRLHQPDLGVIDLRLAEDRFGTEVAASLCPGGGFGALYSTGNPDHPLLANAAGEACLAKPYSPEALLSALRVVQERMTKVTPLSSFPPGFRLLHA
jgi:DNA-binding response OmpR family regulator